MALKPLYSVKAKAATTQLSTKNKSTRLQPSYSVKAAEQKVSTTTSPVIKSLPNNLGGGEYLSVPGQPNTLATTTRSTGSLKTKKGMEIDHIFPVSLGGTSNDPNLEYLQGANWWDKTFVKDPFKQTSRQQGKMAVELKAIEDYQKGKISLPEARLRVVTWNTKPESVISLFAKELVNPASYAKTAGAIAGTVAGNVKKTLGAAKLPLEVAADAFKLGKDIITNPTLKAADAELKRPETYAKTAKLFANSSYDLISSIPGTAKTIGTLMGKAPFEITKSVAGLTKEVIKDPKKYTDTLKSTPAAFVKDVMKPYVNVGIGELQSLKSMADYAEWKNVPGAEAVSDKLGAWADLAGAKEKKNFLEQTEMGLGSAATFFLPGLGTMGATGLVAKFSPTIANLFGLSVSTFLESAAEAGDTYSTSLEQDPGDEKLANKRASFVFNTNIALNLVTNRLGIFSDQGRGIIGRILTAYPEATQEFVQQMAQNKAFDKPLTEGATTAGLIGGIISVFLGGGGNVVIPPQVQEEIQKIPEYPDFKRAAMTEAQEPVAMEEAPAFKRGLVPRPTEVSVTSSIIEQLKGKGEVSKQFISDLTNQPQLKQTEKDLVRDLLEQETGDKINASQFAEKIRAELLPLQKVNKSNKYEQITLPDDLRGNVAEYKENIYESPTKTSAGQVHFPGATDNYFGHVRVEDMENKNTRRVIEVQSDLYQKGNLEKEFQPLTEGEKLSDLAPAARKEYLGLEKKYKGLYQYNDPTAHFRMIREEVKQAAIDGKTKLQFPTGETAMKIEGLGEENRWLPGFDPGSAEFLEIDDLKVGKEIFPSLASSESEGWIITDVLGDGKFKAVPKQVSTSAVGMEAEGARGVSGMVDFNDFSKAQQKQIAESLSETFDISGKVDTSNPIYKFYEKDLGKYLTNKYQAKRITDDKGVSWYEIDVPKSAATEPVPAFRRGTSFVREIPSEGQSTISYEEAQRKAKEMLRRLGVEGVDFKLVDTIFTGEVANGKRITAEASAYDNTVSLTENVRQFAGEHENIHIIFRNLANIPVFDGITKNDLLRELSTKYPDTPAYWLEERLAEDFELYCEKEMTKPEAIKSFGQKTAEFFSRLYAQLKQLFGVGEELSIIDDFYYRAYHEKAPEGITTKLQHRGEIDRFISKQDDKMVLDFSGIIDTELRDATFKRSKLENKVASLTGKIENIKEKVKIESRKQEVKKLKEGIKLRIRLEKQTAGQKILKERVLNQLKNKADVQKVQASVYSFVRNSLPMASRGKFLKSVSTAKTNTDVSEVFRKVLKEIDVIRQKEMISAIKDTLDGIEKLPLRYQYLIGQQLKGVSMKAMTQETRAKLQDLRDLVSTDPQIVAEFGRTGVKQLERLGELEATPIRELSIAELGQITDEVLALAREGKIYREVKQRVDEARREKILNELKAQSTNIDTQTVNVIAREMTKQEERQQFKENVAQDIKNGRMNFFSTDIGFEILDGGKVMGANWQTFKKPFDSVYDGQNEVSNTFVKHYYDTKAAIERHFGQPLRKHNFQRIFIYATKQQQGGVEKLLKSGIDQSLIDSIGLTEQEMMYYRYLRANLDNIRPLIDSTLQQVYDRPLGKVENYFPYQTDFANSDEVYARLEGDYNITSRSAQGFTKTRNFAGKQTLRLNAEEVYLKHIKDAIYFAYTEPVLHEMGKLARSPEYAKAVGKNGQRWVMGWVDLMARKGIAKGWKPSLVDKVLNNIGAGVLGFKLSPILKQPIAKITSGAFLGRHVVAHDYEYFTEGLWKNVQEASRQQRFRNLDDPAYSELEKTDKLQEWQRRGYYFIKTLDSVTADSVWYAAYHKWHDDNNMDFNLEGFKAGQYEPEAVAYADYVVRRTQGSSEAKDIARMLTGENRTFWRSIFKFQNFVINESYLILNDLPREVKNKRWSESSAIVVAFIASGLAESYISSAMVGLFSGDADRKDEEFKRSMWSRMVDVLAGKIPGINNLYSAFKYDASGLVLIDVYNNLVKGSKVAITGKEPLTKAKGVVRATESIGEFAGISGSSQIAQLTKLLLSQLDPENRTKRILKHLESLEPEEAAEAFIILQEEDEEMANKVKRLKEDIDLGITAEDKALKALGVKNGERATAIFDKLEKLETEEEKANLWEEYTNKKIISDEVASQLNTLLNQ